MTRGEGGTSTPASRHLHPDRHRITVRRRADTQRVIRAQPGFLWIAAATCGQGLARRRVAARSTA